LTPDQPRHLPQAPERVQRLILRLLLGDEQERFWPLEVVVHQVGDQITVLNALVALSDAGLVHRWGRYVIPTRAAMHFYWLLG
jgi:membrane-associated PAP2 superfamily phosphatase